MELTKMAVVSFIALFGTIGLCIWIFIDVFVRHHHDWNHEAGIQVRKDGEFQRKVCRTCEKIKYKKIKILNDGWREITK